jgi:hypothetical protein
MSDYFKLWYDEISTHKSKVIVKPSGTGQRIVVCNAHNSPGRSNTGKDTDRVKDDDYDESEEELC